MSGVCEVSRECGACGMSGACGMGGAYVGCDLFINWLICLLISHVVLAHGYFAYVNEISFAYPEHLVHGGVAS